VRGFYDLVIGGHLVEYKGQKKKSEVIAFCLLFFYYEKALKWGFFKQRIEQW
jgi:hypothetical protein